MLDTELLAAAENVYDGWFTEDTRIDWNDFIDRLEIYSDTDLGSNMLSPQIKAIQQHIRKYRKL
jgi:hypothetical protein